MWAAEPRKRLFSVLAEAYTDIRDNHLETVPLDKFLAVTAQELPVVPADEYLLKMGWVLTILSTDQGNITRSATFSADDVDSAYPAHTNKSSIDLVNHCYDSGMLLRSSRLLPTTRARANVMAMPIAAAAPAPATTAPLTPAPAAPVQSQVSAFDDFDVSFAHALTTEGSTKSKQFEQSLQALAAPPDPMSDFNFNDPIMNFRPDYQPSINAITADQQRAYEQTPFSLHFHPDIQPPVLGFDPNMIQDEFDPFSLFDLSM